MRFHWKSYYEQRNYVAKNIYEDLKRITLSQINKNNIYGFEICRIKNNPRNIYVKCPQCKAFVHHLYILDDKYSCRTCLKLCYKIQRVREPKRAFLMIQKLLRRKQTTKIQKRIAYYKYKYELAIEKELRERFDNNKLI